jgi:putative transposase
MLTEKIRQIHDESRGTYEPRRLHVALQAEGYAAGENRIARLMKEAGLRGVGRRKVPMN